jgi:endonuclease IV
MFLFMKAIKRKGDFRLGGIGIMGFKAWPQHPILARIPMILETRKDKPEADSRDLHVIRRLAGQSTGRSR